MIMDEEKQALLKDVEIRRLLKIPVEDLDPFIEKRCVLRDNLRKAAQELEDAKSKRIEAQSKFSHEYNSVEIDNNVANLEQKAEEASVAFRNFVTVRIGEATGVATELYHAVKDTKRAARYSAIFATSIPAAIVTYKILTGTYTMNQNLEELLYDTGDSFTGGIAFAVSIVSYLFSMSKIYNNHRNMKKFKKLTGYGNMEEYVSRLSERADYIAKNIVKIDISDRNGVFSRV